MTPTLRRQSTKHDDTRLSPLVTMLERDLKDYGLLLPNTIYSIHFLIIYINVLPHIRTLTTKAKEQLFSDNALLTLSKFLKRFYASRVRSAVLHGYIWTELSTELSSDDKQKMLTMVLEKMSLDTTKLAKSVATNLNSTSWNFGQATALLDNKGLIFDYEPTTQEYLDIEFTYQSSRTYIFLIKLRISELISYIDRNGLELDQETLANAFQTHPVFVDQDQLLTNDIFLLINSILIKGIMKQDDSTDSQPENQEKNLDHESKDQLSTDDIILKPSEMLIFPRKGEHSPQHVRRTIERTRGDLHTSEGTYLSADNSINRNRDEESFQRMIKLSTDQDGPSKKLVLKASNLAKLSTTNNGEETHSLNKIIENIITNSQLDQLPPWYNLINQVNLIIDNLKFATTKFDRYRIGQDMLFIKSYLDEQDYEILLKPLSINNDGMANQCLPDKE